MTHEHAHCSSTWRTASDTQHRCSKPAGHEHACYCCDDPDYPGGNLATLNLERDGTRG